MLKAISTITNALGALNYKGTWNASTNTPTLADGTGAKGDYYVVSTAGTQTFDGILLFFGAGDWIVYNGAVWQRVEGGSDGNFSNVTLNSTDAGATAGPLLDLYRNSATPAASDTIGEIEFNGKDSAGNKQQYALIHGSILSPTSTTEQGQIHFETATAGASTEKMIIGTTNLVINDIGAVFNVRIEGDTDANLFYTDATNSRIGVGTLSPANKLDVNGTFGASGVSSFAAGTALLPAITTTGDTNTGVLFPAADTIAFATAGAERARISSIGNVCVNSTSAIVNSQEGFGVIALDGTGPAGSFKNSAGATSAAIECWNSATTGDNRFITFTTDAYVTRGSITFNRAGGLTAYNVTSDYRAKTVNGPVQNALSKVSLLTPSSGRMNGASEDIDFFVAHELQEIVPSAVTGIKDAVNADGSPNLQMIDKSALIPLLTAAIQELKELVDRQAEAIAKLQEGKI
ncbi:hypothetical protein UFOVP1024_44 [uncultured Caudovirales phage]|uniref:Peptidase S74 domain-containing protein n=1 Tax=uncultured Caudovirales phage TaxID=2100421 RepID=A0A6J5PPF7_9CAUD|nr:hypothetical protein UFOVP949_23 [uncultured Caudovirales phage]CAB4179169.1 hypothetical protein UFOVP1024_44 [uncultured Caudovirales phage]